MSVFEDFLDKHGKGTKCKEATVKIVDKYKKKLPEELIRFWEEEGFCAYGDGLIWVVNPDDFKYVADEWFDDKVKRVVFARSGFADFYLWSEKEGVEQLYTQHKRAMVVSPELPFFFNYALNQERYIKSNLYSKLFKQAVKKFGAPDYDECFGFEPALELGGEEKIENVKKVKLEPYLEILSQL
ncbi:MAG TPA: GAD-like domain-containing protein [Pyrinomonadaceae bacterium]|jgi:hypothetical protein